MAGDRDLVVLGGEIKTPPLSTEARQEVGGLIRLLQRGVSLSLPVSRPMPVIGARCHELRIDDGEVTWRVVYRTDKEEILVVEVFAKKTQTTPKKVIEVCKRRLKQWDR